MTQAIKTSGYDSSGGFVSVEFEVNEDGDYCTITTGNDEDSIISFNWNELREVMQKALEIWPEFKSSAHTTDAS